MGKKRVIISVIIIILAAIFAFSLYNILKILEEYKAVEKEDEYLQTEFIQGKEDKTEENYRIKINWKKLLKINSDVIAWIDIPNTNISYPILKGETNQEYLYLDIHRNYIRSGSIFVESIQKNPFVDFNTIIYGHNLKNGSMFSDLEKYNNAKFAKNHPIVYIYTPDGRCREYQVFSLQKTNTSDTDIYQVDVEDKEEYINISQRDSLIQTKIDETKITSMLTLSTCTNAFYEERYVLHAVLLEGE